MRGRLLDGFTSIKVKLGTAIVVAVGATIVVLYLLLSFTLPGSVRYYDVVTTRGIWHETAMFLRDAWWLMLVAAGLAAGVALGLVRMLARGMTRPLREMERAATAMARGDYSQRVTTSSRDEVGRLADAFNHMAGELERVERLRRELVANVSHELKTPIAAIRAHLENLLEGIEQPDPATLDVMLRQSERLSALVEQVLDLSQIESGSVPPALEPVPAAAAISQVVSEVRIGRDTARVRVEIAGEPVALADRARLHQVLYNLIDNALRHGPGGHEVVVRAAAAGGEIRFDVEDDGAGIPEADLPHVFERFYRADASRSRAGGGAGLGLAIARSIVQSHGGRIWAERRVPTGTRFSFTLRAGTPPAANQGSSTKPAPPQGLVRAGRSRIAKEDV